MNYTILITVIFYGIIRAILETKVWAEREEKRKERYHFYRYIETILVGILIFLSTMNIAHSIAFLFIINLIFESVYNYKVYGYIDRNKHFKLFNKSYYIKFKYHIALFLIGIILIVIF